MSQEITRAITGAIADDIAMILHGGVKSGGLTLSTNGHQVKHYPYTSVVTADIDHSSGVTMYRTTIRVETIEVVDPEVRRP